MKLPTLPALLFLALAASHAADPVALPSAPAPSAAPTVATSTARPRASALNIDFPGGSIAQLVAHLNQPDGPVFNLIGEGLHQATTLPKFQLRNIDPTSLAAALNGLIRPSGLTLSLAGTNIFVLTKSTSLTASFLPSPPTFQAYQLAPYLPTVALEDITDAITTAWSSDPKHDPKAVTFKFHPATKILFVYGPSEAIAMATQLIPQLSPTATARAQREAYASAATTLSLTSPMPYTSTVVSDPAAEQARLESVAQEVRRRRGEREAAGAVVR